MFGKEYIWVIYTFGALFTILLNLSITKFLRFLPIEKINTYALLFAAFNMFIMAFSTFPASVFFAYIIYIFMSEYLYLLASVMVEDLSKNNQTGTIRGRFLSMLNLGYLLSPFLSYFLIKYFSFQSIFLLSGVFVLFALFVSKFMIGNLPKISPENFNIKNTWSLLLKNYDIRTIFLANISFYIFGIGLIVYLPFRLGEVGISLETYLSVILPVALLPFVILPYYLGHLEDEFRDEKGFLIFSLFGLILSLFLFVYIDSRSVLVWAGLVFLARVFGAIAETSVNSYFFKKVDKTNTSIISIFTTSKQFAYLFFTPILSLILIKGNLSAVFLSIAFWLTFMIVLVSKLHGTENHEKHRIQKEIWRRIKGRA
jgi:MFS family permease